MKKIAYVLILSLLGWTAQAQESAPKTNRIMLPNGWALSPAGKSLPLGDLPLNMAISKSKQWMAVTNNGQSKQSIQLINTQTDQILDNIIIDKSWLGIAFSNDEKYLYASGGNDNWILQYAVVNDKLGVKTETGSGFVSPNVGAVNTLEVKTALSSEFLSSNDVSGFTKELGSGL